MSFYLDAAFVMLQICTFCDMHVSFFAHSSLYKLFHGTNVLQKQFNFVLVFNKFANGFAHINFNCKDDHKFAKKFANVQTFTNFLSVEDSSKLHGNIRKFVISLWMHRRFPPKQKKAVFFFQDACFSTNVQFFWP